MHSWGQKTTRQEEEEIASKLQQKLGMVTHACNPSIQDPEVGGAH